MYFCCKEFINKKSFQMLKKDIDYKKCIIIAVLFTFFRLWLTSRQMIFTMPLSAPLDDDLYFNMANSIVRGEWLGSYNCLTLSKYPFFAIYLAFLHVTGIPYLLGNCILWVLCGALCVWAFNPILKKNYHKLCLYLLLIFNPSTFADYTLRVYRDSFFPIICTAFFVAVAGWGLRIKDDIKKSTPFIIIASLTMGIAYVTREDGYWIIPFFAGAVIICAVYTLCDKSLKQKALRLVMWVVPFIITGAFVFTICFINNKYYGKFILTDFNSGSFARCYGNMTRLSHEDWNGLVAVPEDVRQRLYEGCDSFKDFEAYLESSNIRTAFLNKELGDFQSGSFYWALRKAAQELGVYESAETAEIFWDKLADEVELLCESDPNALSPRNSVTPPIKKEYVAPVIKQAVDSTVYILKWQDIQGFTNALSDSSTGQIEKWEAFTHCNSNYSAIEYTALPYYTPSQKVAFKIMDIITWIYRVLTVPCIVLSLIGIIINFFKFKKISHKKQIANFILLGFLCMAMFRIFIICYMEVAAFNIGIYSMYYGAVYPLIVLICFIGIINALRSSNCC